MYPAQARSVRKPCDTVVGALLAVAVLVAAPAFAAHMAGNERGEYVDDASANSQESQNRRVPESDASEGANLNSLRALPDSESARPSRSYESKPVGIVAIEDLLRREIIIEASGDKTDLAAPDIAPQPEKSATINTRIPGLSDDSLARFKNRMYRRDI